MGWLSTRSKDRRDKKSWFLQHPERKSDKHILWTTSSTHLYVRLVVISVGRILTGCTLTGRTSTGLVVAEGAEKTREKTEITTTKLSDWRDGGKKEEKLIGWSYEEGMKKKKTLQYIKREKARGQRQWDSTPPHADVRRRRKRLELPRRHEVIHSTKREVW
jgi:hypothetical protein